MKPTESGTSHADLTEMPLQLDGEKFPVEAKDVFMNLISINYKPYLALRQP